MDPINDHERAIAQAVDEKFREDPGDRQHVIIRDVAESLDFVMSVSDSQFLVSYVQWRRSTDASRAENEKTSIDSRTVSTLARPPYHSHIVYPYTDDRRLVDAVGFYTESGLGREGAVILIATEAHSSAIKKYLKSDGHIEVLEASGQLVFLDAAELMNTFMVDGNPDPKLFKTGIRTLIERASRDPHTGRNREVRLFGEMVSLLWPSNSPAAERLEELGNEVTEEYSIPIFCAYSLNGPGRSPLSESLIRAHSHSIAW